MTRFLLAAFTALITSVPTMGQVAFSFAERQSTRFGEIHAQGADYKFTLWHDETLLPLPENARWWVQWSQEGQGAYDWAIAQHHHGGNSCGGGIYLLRVSEEGVRHSREISDCAGQLLDIRTDAGWIEVDREDWNIEVSSVTIRWDGDAFSETYHYAPPMPPAGSGAEVTRWIGDSGYIILQDASERARFGAAMQIEDMQDLWTRLGVGTGVMRAGGWIFATGCQPHACGLDMGAIGIRISDGAPAAIIRSSGQPDRRFGLADDPAFQAAVAEGLE